MLQYIFWPGVQVYLTESKKTSDHDLCIHICIPIDNYCEKGFKTSIIQHCCSSLQATWAYRNLRETFFEPYLYPPFCLRRLLTRLRVSTHPQVVIIKANLKMRNVSITRPKEFLLSLTVLQREQLFQLPPNQRKTQCSIEKNGFGNSGQVLSAFKLHPTTNI